jgi:regulatory protein
MTKPLNLRQKALDLISRAEYSSLELKQKLSRYSDDEQQIEQIVTQFIEQNLLNDARYIENFAYFKGRKYGQQKIRYLLQQKIADANLIQEHYQPDSQQEFDTAKQLWLRKFHGQLATTPQEKNKQIRFLLSRGFSWETVLKVIVADATNSID